MHLRCIHVGWVICLLASHRLKCRKRCVLLARLNIRRLETCLIMLIWGLKSPTLYSYILSPSLPLHVFIHFLDTPYPSLSLSKRTCFLNDPPSFDGFWKVKKVKYVVLCLNDLAKLQNTRGVSHRPAFMDNFPTRWSWPYQSTNRFVISPFQVVCGAWDSLATEEVPLEKKVDMKCMQVNVLKNIAKITRRLIMCSYHVTCAF